MARRKGTNAFTVRGADAQATADTSPAKHAQYLARDERQAKPVWPYTYEQMLAWYETTTPGGEFNADFARWEFEAATGAPLT